MSEPNLADLIDPLLAGKIVPAVLRKAQDDRYITSHTISPEDLALAQKRAAQVLAREQNTKDNSDTGYAPNGK